jgi:hypothetical protein
MCLADAGLTIFCFVALSSLPSPYLKGQSFSLFSTESIEKQLIAQCIRALAWPIRVRNRPPKQAAADPYKQFWHSKTPSKKALQNQPNHTFLKIQPIQTSP